MRIYLLNISLQQHFNNLICCSNGQKTKYIFTSEHKLCAKFSRSQIKQLNLSFFGELSLSKKLQNSLNKTTQI